MLFLWLFLALVMFFLTAVVMPTPNPVTYTREFQMTYIPEKNSPL